LAAPTARTCLTPTAAKPSTSASTAITAGKVKANSAVTMPRQLQLALPVQAKGAARPPPPPPPPPLAFIPSVYL